jgi:hypothetical protein
MKLLFTAILFLVIQSAYCQYKDIRQVNLTVQDELLEGTAIISMHSKKIEEQPNYIRPTLVLKTKSPDDENKTRGGIILKNTLLGAGTGAIIGLGLAGASKNEDGSSKATFREFVGLTVIGAGVGIPIGFLVGSVKAITHKRNKSALN